VPKKPPPDFDALLDDLKNPNWKVRCQAAQTLGLKKHRPAVEPLLELLQKDKSETVRSRAAVALGRIQDPRAIEPLLNAGCVKYALGAVEKFGPAAAPALIAEFNDRTQPVSSRCVMLHMLGNVGGDEAVKALVAAADEKDPTVRWSAATALGRTGGERAVKTLIVLLNDVVPMVGSAAAEALGHLRDERAVEAIVRLFHGDRPFEGEFDYFRSATNVLRMWADVRGKSFHEVEPYLYDADRLKRIAAALSLTWLRDERALEPLRQATRDSDPLVRHAAMWAHDSLETLLSYNVPLDPLVISLLLK
jgi:HEAT repeat protein